MRLRCLPRAPWAPTARECGPLMGAAACDGGGCCVRLRCLPRAPWAPTARECGPLIGGRCRRVSFGGLRMPPPLKLMLCRTVGTWLDIASLSSAYLRPPRQIYWPAKLGRTDCRLWGLFVHGLKSPHYQALICARHVRFIGPRSSGGLIADCGDCLFMA